MNTHLALIANPPHSTAPLAKTIVVRIKNVYGVEKIYPVCDSAHTFAQLVKQQTLTDQDIRLIKNLGYTVQVAPQQLPNTL